MPTPGFVTTIYGRDYAPFLAAHLHAIGEAYPDATVLVLWRDLPPREVEALRIGFPRARFEPIEDPIEGGLHQRIARKLHAWVAACAHFPDGPIAMLDCDALPFRPLGPVMEGEWDVVFTWKDEPFPINTGVMLFRSGRIARVVLGEMASRVERIIARQDLLNTALGSSGAADQHALREMIGWVHYDRDIVRTIDGHEIVFRGVPCRELNETNCRPITDDLRIIHYKTGWHPILLEGKPWTANRPQDRCREMYEHFQSVRAQSDRAVARRVVLDSARALRDRFAPFADGYEERGILNSEMLAACAVAQSLGAQIIIESGRARGQSTRTLARYFAGTGVRIISLELERDADAQYAEEQLRPFPHVQLLYGDAFRTLPSLLERHAGQRVALLVDGPKGLPAIDLIDRAHSEHENVVASFLHDTRRQTPQRERLESGSYRAFFTDDPEYVETFGALDRACEPKAGQAITMHTWRPYMKGEDKIPSYGPTLAIILPRPARVPAPATRSEKA